jgi:hypothetical protein
LASHVLPLLQSVASKDYFFLELLVVLLKLSQVFLAFSLIHKDMIRLVLVLLVISSFEQIFFSIATLQVELFLEFDVIDIGTQLDHIVPKLLLLLVGLLYEPDSHIR